MEPNVTVNFNCEHGHEFVNTYYDVVAKAKERDKKWIKELRDNGVKACHPNDGWVDRELNRVHFAYPQFNDGVNVGDKIMLGWSFDEKRQRLVEVTDIKTSLLMYYYFKDVREPINFITRKSQKQPTKNGRSIFYIACYKLAVLFGFVRWQNK